MALRDLYYLVPVLVGLVVYGGVSWEYSDALGMWEWFITPVVYVVAFLILYRWRDSSRAVGTWR